MTACYFCYGTALLQSGEECACAKGKCHCVHCRQSFKNSEQFKKAWHEPAINGYDKERYDFKDKHGNTILKTPVKKKVIKPDPATVEAELQLEESLWQS
jgi:hypothetical protein